MGLFDDQVAVIDTRSMTLATTVSIFSLQFSPALPNQRAA